MPRYHVEIVEEIKEIRVYEVDAPDTLSAAEQARNLWIEQGIPPTDPVQKEIEEREYVVTDIASEQEVIESYDEAVLIELLAERESGEAAEAILVNELPSVLQLCTNNAPSNKPTFSPLRYTYTEHGTIVWPKDPAILSEDNQAAWWWDINKWAFENNCKIIEFDQANDVDPRFHVWNW